MVSLGSIGFMKKTKGDNVFNMKYYSSEWHIFKFLQI